MAQGQGGFRKKYHLSNSTTSISRDVIEVPNGYIISGTTIDSVGGFSRMTLIGIDHSGVVQWRKDYGNSKFQYIDNLFHVRGPVVKSLNSFYHTVCVKDSTNQHIGVLLNIDFNGDTIWQKIYGIGTPKDIIPQGLSRSIDGGFLLTGLSQNWGSDGGWRTNVYCYKN